MDQQKVRQHRGSNHGLHIFNWPKLMTMTTLRSKYLSQVLEIFVSFWYLLRTTQPISLNMREFRSRIILGLFWLSMAVNKVRCTCPYANGVRVTLSGDRCRYVEDNEVKLWPDILKDIDQANLKLKDCKNVCIESYGLEMIILHEKNLETCEETMAVFASNTRVTRVPSSGPRDMMVFERVYEEKNGEIVDNGIKLVQDMKVAVSFGDVKDTNKSLWFARDYYFSFDTDALEIPADLFGRFQRTKATFVIVQFPSLHEIKVNKLRVMKSTDSQYVFGKAVLEQLHYSMELERSPDGMRVDYSVAIVPLEKSKSSPKHAQQSTSKSNFSSSNPLKLLKSMICKK